MSGRRSSRSKKPVSYIDLDLQDSKMQQVTDDLDDEVDHSIPTASDDADPDFIAELNMSSEIHQMETEKENLPAKKRKTIHDFMRPSVNNQSARESEPPPIRTNQGNSDKEGTASSSQVSRLDELQRAMSERGRNSLSNHCDRSDESFTGILSGINTVRARGTPLRSPSSVNSSKGKGGKNKIDGNTVEQWRRQLGNSCKANISFEKWTIAAKTHFTTDFTLGAFRALIVPNASEVHPVNFNESTPVVVASTKSTSQAAAIFGSSKIKGGSRFGTFNAGEAEFVFVASTKKLSVWWTMDGW